MSDASKYVHIRPGMTVAVDQTIKEETPKGDMRERIQTFEGIVIHESGAGQSRTITIRKVSNGVGVEKIFPLGMPSIADIQVVKETRVRRAKLTFLRKPQARELHEPRKAVKAGAKKVAAKK